MPALKTLALFMFTITSISVTEPQITSTATALSTAPDGKALSVHSPQNITRIDTENINGHLELTTLELTSSQYSESAEGNGVTNDAEVVSDITDITEDSHGNSDIYENYESKDEDSVSVSSDKNGNETEGEETAKNVTDGIRSDLVPSGNFVGIDGGYTLITESVPVSEPYEPTTDLPEKGNATHIQDEDPSTEESEEELFMGSEETNNLLFELDPSDTNLLKNEFADILTTSAYTSANIDALEEVEKILSKSTSYFTNTTEMTNFGTVDTTSSDEKNYASTVAATFLAENINADINKQKEIVHEINPNTLSELEDSVQKSNEIVDHDPKTIDIDNDSYVISEEVLDTVETTNTSDEKSTILSAGKDYDYNSGITDETSSQENNTEKKTSDEDIKDTVNVLDASNPISLRHEANTSSAIEGITETSFTPKEIIATKEIEDGISVPEYNLRASHVADEASTSPVVEEITKSSFTSEEINANEKADDDISISAEENLGASHPAGLGNEANSSPVAEEITGSSFTSEENKANEEADDDVTISAEADLGASHQAVGLEGEVNTSSVNEETAAPFASGKMKILEETEDGFSSSDEESTSSISEKTTETSTSNEMKVTEEVEGGISVSVVDNLSATDDSLGNGSSISAVIKEITGTSFTPEDFKVNDKDNNNTSDDDNVSTSQAISLGNTANTISVVEEITGASFTSEETFGNDETEDNINTSAGDDVKAPEAIGGFTKDNLRSAISSSDEESTSLISEKTTETSTSNEMKVTEEVEDGIGVSVIDNLSATDDSLGNGSSISPVIKEITGTSFTSEDIIINEEDNSNTSDDNNLSTSQAISLGNTANTISVIEEITGASFTSEETFGNGETEDNINTSAGDDVKAPEAIDLGTETSTSSPKEKVATSLASESINLATTTDNISRFEKAMNISTSDVTEILNSTNIPETTIPLYLNESSYEDFIQIIEHRIDAQKDTIGDTSTTEMTSSVSSEASNEENYSEHSGEITEASAVNDAVADASAETQDNNTEFSTTESNLGTDTYVPAFMEDPDPDSLITTDKPLDTTTNEIEAKGVSSKETLEHEESNISNEAEYDEYTTSAKKATDETYSEFYSYIVEASTLNTLQHFTDTNKKYSTYSNEIRGTSSVTDDNPINTDIYLTTNKPVEMDVTVDDTSSEISTLEVPSSRYTEVYTVPSVTLNDENHVKLTSTSSAEDNNSKANTDDALGFGIKDTLETTTSDVVTDTIIDVSSNKSFEPFRSVETDFTETTTNDTNDNVSGNKLNTTEASYWDIYEVSTLTSNDDYLNGQTIDSSFIPYTDSATSTESTNFLATKQSPETAKIIERINISGEEHGMESKSIEDSSIELIVTTESSILDTKTSTTVSAVDDDNIEILVEENASITNLYDANFPSKGNSVEAVTHNSEESTTPLSVKMEGINMTENSLESSEVTSKTDETETINVQFSTETLFAGVTESVFTESGFEEETLDKIEKELFGIVTYETETSSTTGQSVDNNVPESIFEEETQEDEEKELFGTENDKTEISSSIGKSVDNVKTEFTTVALTLASNPTTALPVGSQTTEKYTTAGTENTAFTFDNVSDSVLLVTTPTNSSHDDLEKNNVTQESSTDGELQKSLAEVFDSFDTIISKLHLVNESTVDAFNKNVYGDRTEFNRSEEYEYNSANENETKLDYFEATTSSIVLKDTFETENAVYNNLNMDATRTYKKNIQAKIFGNKANFSIKILIQNTSFYVPSDAHIFEDLDQLTLNISWSSLTKLLNNSLFLSLTEISRFYFIKDVQLNLVRDDDFDIWRQNVIMGPVSDSSGKTVCIIKLLDDVEIIFSSIDFLKMAHLDVESNDVDSMAAEIRREKAGIGIAIGCVAAAIFVCLAIYLVISRSRRRVLNIGNLAKNDIPA